MIRRQTGITRAGLAILALLGCAAALPSPAAAQLTGQVCDADIVLMLDRTGSMAASDLTDERTAAKAFLNTLGGAAVPPYVSIGAFGDNTNGGLEAFIRESLGRPYGDDDAASDSDHYAAVDFVTASNSSVGTSVADALTVAGTELTSNGLTSSRVIILISDGDPSEPTSATAGRESAYDVSDTLKLAGREIYTIHFGEDPAGFAGQELMAAIATGSTAPPSTDSHNTHGHQSGSSDDKATAALENSDGDNFFIAPSASSMTTILNQIAAQYCESLPTATRTGTATSTPTSTPTLTATVTHTPVNTATRTATITNTPANTSTATATITNTPVNTATRTPTITNTPVNTATSTFTVTYTPTYTFTPTLTATATVTNTPVNTATGTATVTNTPVNTATSSATATSTPTHTFTSTATFTATVTNTPEDTATPTATATATDTVTATPTVTETFTPTLSSTPTATATGTETATATASATGTETLTPTVTETPVPTQTATATPTPYCGDGTVNPGESCDDGNGVDGDGCDADCSVTTACTLVYPGTERFVGGCGAPTYADIQAAIDAAVDGDTVTICAGTYTQPVTVTKQVAIRAATGAAVTVHTSGNAFDLRRSGVRIDGLTIQSDLGAAIIANDICPLGQSSCSLPGSGSHLRINDNTIVDSPVGITWLRKIDCVEITENTLTDNPAHILLTQLEGAPATQVTIAQNVITGGGQSGGSVVLSGLGAIVAANTVADSATAGIVLTNVVSTQIIENNIDRNTGDGITIKTGADTTQIHDNNITRNGVGLGNESGSGTLDATLNWWNSQTGPSGLFTGVGDEIVNRVPGGTTLFIEFLCGPFPAGFPSVQGICSIEVAELKQLVPGRAPDLDPFGRYIVFESTANIDVDQRTTLQNADGSQEVFLLNRRPKKKLTGVCLGGLQSCDFDNLPSCQTCNGPKQCPGDPAADPIVLNGECVIVTQLSDGSPAQLSGKPRLSGTAKNTFFSSSDDQLGDNGDGSIEIRNFNRKLFEKLQPPLVSKTSDGPPVTYDGPVPSLNSKYVYVESNGDPTGENADGNLEIFLLKTRSNEWIQVTNTVAPVENRRPATTTGRRIIFDSDGDLTGANPDGNRELFIAQVKGRGLVIQQVTHTVAPVENRSGSMDSNSAIIAFSSNGDFVGQNADGNREIFTWHRRFGTFEQLTHSPSGDNANPVINQGKRFVVFESTADLTNSGATNRRIFQIDRVTNRLTLLSRSRFGTNEKPRIRKRRFVVWESTANLTGKNPGNDWVIYVFDRKKD